MKEHLPNFITTLNIFSGILAIMYIYDKEFKFAIILILIGILLDGIDGYVARVLKINNKSGKYLDSIADMFTFCFAPAMLLYGMYYDIEKGMSFIKSFDNGIVITTSAFIAVFGIYRLARFIESENDDKYFKGLPTPAGALGIVLFVIIIENIYFVMLLSFMISLLMISKIRYIKFNGFFRFIIGLIIIVETITYFVESMAFSLITVGFLTLYILSPLYYLRDKQGEPQHEII